MVYTNKKINKLKLALTTKCNLSCPYCFVKKTGEDMDPGLAKKAINILLESGGKEKLLSLYGGELLLKFGLVKDICNYAHYLAKEKNKKLTISICTNATLIDQKMLDFLKKIDVKIILTLFGDKKAQDAVRIFRNGTGTYKIIVKKIPLLFEKIKKSNLGISFCVLPETTKDLFKNFTHLIKLGFNHINLEIIQDYHVWKEKDILLFRKNYLKIVRYVLSELNKGNFIFLNPINWEIKHKLLSNFNGVYCPFNYLLEMYPQGEMAFSPFLLNLKDRQNFIVCNLKKDKHNKFDKCNFSKEKLVCKKCIKDYFKNYEFDKKANIVTGIYRDESLKTAETIIKLAENNINYANYVKKIKKEICF